MTRRQLSAAKPFNRTAPDFLIFEKRMSFYAGGDWTATPSLNDKRPYGFALVAVEDVETLADAFARIRHDVGFAARAELRGHDAPPQVQAAVLQVLAAQNARISVLLLDKTPLLAEPPTHWLNATLMHQQLAMATLQRTLPHYPLANLKCDEELRGQAQKAFVTDVKRLHQSLWPGQRLKMKLLPSHTSVLVQAADIVAYNFSRFIRNALHDELHAQIQFLRTQKFNDFVKVKNWNDDVRGSLKIDLRP